MVTRWSIVGQFKLLGSRSRHLLYTSFWLLIVDLTHHPTTPMNHGTLITAHLRWSNFYLPYDEKKQKQQWKVERNFTQDLLESEAFQVEFHDKKLFFYLLYLGRYELRTIHTNSSIYLGNLEQSRAKAPDTTKASIAGSSVKLNYIEQVYSLHSTWWYINICVTCVCK